MSVSLAKPVDLTNTRKIAIAALAAYHDGTLQAVKHFNGGEGGQCSYVGPCAIGVSIDAETRKAWDQNYNGQSIVAIMHDQLAIGDSDALSGMQGAHDSFSTQPKSEKQHLRFLIVTTFYAMGLDG